MREVHRSVTVDATPEKVFDLVSNVAGYPEFIDSCTRARVVKQGTDETTAELTLNQGVISDDYRVRLQLDRPGNITMHFDIEAPLRLQAQWRFTAMDQNQCRVDMIARYAASSRAKEFLLKPIAKRISAQLIDAVAARAAKL